jgi:hypothetical protein
MRRPPHESPLSAFPVFCFLFWVGQERFVDILDGTAGLGLTEQERHDVVSGGKRGILDDG